MKKSISTLVCTLLFAANMLHAQSSITILSPTVNDRWSRGFPYPIRWAVTDVDSVKIEYSAVGASGPWVLISSGIPSGSHGEFDRFTRTGRYYWAIPYSVYDSCFIRVSHRSNSSVLDVKRFTVLTSPHWVPHVSEVDVPLYAASAISRGWQYLDGWVGGKNGVILKTTDNAVHWSVCTMVEGDIHRIAAFDMVTALAASIVATGSARINRTTDGGTSWTVVDATPAVWRDIRMFDPSIGYAFGDPVGGFWVLKRTTDGGATWSDFPVPLAASAGEESRDNAMTWFDTSRGWFGTNNGRIYRTTDGGTTWQISSLEPGSASVTSLYFNNTLFGLAGCGDGSIYRTTNGGATWSLGPSVLPSAVVGIGGLTYSLECWAACGRDVYHSIDRGATWNVTSYNGYAGIAQLNYLSVAGLSSWGYGWAVGDGGTIIGFRRVLTDVRPNPADAPVSHALFQNYPNPFNPTTAISYHLPGVRFVTLKVFDILGREVATLVSEVKEMGEYKVSWDATGFPSGVYFYRISAVPLARRDLVLKDGHAGDFVQTRKLMLLK